VPIMSCPLGCGPYETDIVVARLISTTHPWLRIFPQETPGWAYNFKLMARDKQRWKDTVFENSTGSIWLGRKGIKPFFEEVTDVPGLKFLFMEGILNHGQFMITLDPNIKSYADMKGKRLGIGLRGQSHWGGFAKVLLEAAGVTEQNAKLDWLGTVGATDALLDGRVDVATGGIATEPSLKEILQLHPVKVLAASGRKFYYVAPGGELIDKVNKQYDAPFIKLTIPNGTLPQQTAEIVVSADVGGKTVHESFPDELAYEITKAFVQTGIEAAKYQALAKLMTPEMFTFGLTEKNTHPGAIRAFKELGLWKGK